MAALPTGLTLGAAATAAGPSDILQPGLRLGPIVFLNDEHPAKLPTPLSERMSIRELPGGFRSVQAMGAQAENITWSGTFWDQQASDKKNAIKAIQKQGLPVTLQWNDEKYSVLIAKFTPTTVDEFRIEYEIECTVIADLCGSFTTAGTRSIDTQTAALYDSANALYATITAIQSAKAPPVPSGLGTGLGSLGSLLGTAGPLAQASVSSITAIAAQVGVINGSLASYTTAISAIIAALPASAIPSSLQQLSVAASQLSNVVTLIGANAQNGQAPRVITVGGGVTLAQIAAQYYGDASLGTTIKADNNLPSMKLPPGVQVKLRLRPATAVGLA